MFGTGNFRKYSNIFSPCFTKLEWTRKYFEIEIKNSSNKIFNTAGVTKKGVPLGYVNKSPQNILDLELLKICPKNNYYLKIEINFQFQNLEYLVLLINFWI